MCGDITFLEKSLGTISTTDHFPSLTAQEVTQNSLHQPWPLNTGLETSALETKSHSCATSSTSSLPPVPAVSDFPQHFTCDFPCVHVVSVSFFARIYRVHGRHYLCPTGEETEEQN